MSHNKIVSIVIFVTMCIICTTALTCYQCEEKRVHGQIQITGSCNQSAWTQIQCNNPALNYCITSRQNSMSNFRQKH